MMTLSKIRFQITALEELCHGYCWRITLFIVKFYVRMGLYFRTDTEIPAVDKPLNPITLSTGISLGTRVVYAQQEVDFDYYKALRNCSLETAEASAPRTSL